MVGVVGDEIFCHAIDIADGRRAAFDLEAALDQLAGAGADQVARRMQRHCRQSFAIEYEVERVDQIGRGVDQRAVEIEDNGGCGRHREALSVSARSCKMA